MARATPLALLVLVLILILVPAPATAGAVQEIPALVSYIVRLLGGLAEIVIGYKKTLDALQAYRQEIQVLILHTPHANKVR